MSECDLRWFHCTTHTYGAWLPGSPMGFRTRDHREHVEGDYKKPPPAGLYEGLHRHCRGAMTQPAVTFPVELRGVVARWLAERLVECHAQVLCACVTATHAHWLAKMPPGAAPMQWLGRAKRHVTFLLRAGPYHWAGKVWAGEGKVTPVNDEGHWRNVRDYILRHAVTEDAGTWDCRTDRKKDGHQ